MSYYEYTVKCGCIIEVEVDARECIGHDDGSYCYCYDYPDGVTDGSIRFCHLHGGDS